LHARLHQCNSADFIIVEALRRQQQQQHLRVLSVTSHWYPHRVLQPFRANFSQYRVCGSATNLIAVQSVPVCTQSSGGTAEPAIVTTTTTTTKLLFKIRRRQFCISLVRCTIATTTAPSRNKTAAYVSVTSATSRDWQLFERALIGRTISTSAFSVTGTFLPTRRIACIRRVSTSPDLHVFKRA
jgi:hypothetical protein